MKYRVLVVCVLAACGEGDAVPDANVDAATMCPAVPRDPDAPGNYIVYFAADGETLMRRSTGCNDSQTNCTTLIAPNPAIVPPLFGTDAARTAKIANIVDLARTALAPFSIDVVTTRPTSGDYLMIVGGGRSEQIINSIGAVGAAQTTCDANNRNAIALLFDRGLNTNDFTYAATFLSDVGYMIGLGNTSTPDDCLCSAITCGVTRTSLCTFGTMATLEQGQCGRTGTQDEQKALLDAFGCR